MNDHIIIVCALLLVYYNIGGLATTNILRLTTGNILSINSRKCVCDNCGSKISPLLQLPIVSYIVCGGKCRDCHSRIPVFPLLLEITVIIGMSLIAAVFRFSPLGVVFSFLFYEMIRLVTIFYKGKRETKFAQQYFVAVLSMIPFILVSLFVSILDQLV